MAGWYQRARVAATATGRSILLVMAGLDPAIHDFLALGNKDVDARHKAGHDED
jgi:hypothetical protein